MAKEGKGTTMTIDEFRVELARLVEKAKIAIAALFLVACGGGDFSAAADGVDAGEIEHHVDAGVDVVNERKSDAGDAPGPPPLICITNDGICQSAGPWPFQCCRSQPCECCNKPNCGG